MSAHAFWRAFLLIALGVFLRSIGKQQTNYTFEDTLSQIGLGYGFLFLLGFRPMRDQWLALGILLVGYWAAFAHYPLPPADFDYAKVGVSSQWLSEHGLSGFAAHWNKNSNIAWAFDTWFLNLWPAARAVCVQRRGLCHVELHSDIGHDDSRADRRQSFAKRADAVAQGDLVDDCRGHVARRGLAARI